MRRAAVATQALAAFNGMEMQHNNFFFVSSCLRGPNTPLITLMLRKAHAARSCRRIEPSEPAGGRWRLAG
jgi:hypothetical protein